MAPNRLPIITEEHFFPYLVRLSKRRTASTTPSTLPAKTSTASTAGKLIVHIQYICVLYNNPQLCREGCQRVGTSGLGSRLSLGVPWGKQCLPTTIGVVISTPQPIKPLSLAPPSRHLDSNQKGECEERTLWRSKTGQTGCKANKCSDSGTPSFGHSIVLPVDCAHQPSIPQNSEICLIRVFLCTEGIRSVAGLCAFSVN